MMSRGGLGGGFGNSLAELFSGIFGHSGRPYEDAMKQFQKYLGPGSQYGNWLNQMQNPQEFYNKMMSGYQQSPMAQQALQQSQNAANNAASAAGLVGSTPLTQFAQQNAKDISQQDMNQYFQNMMGINNTYGQGLGGNANMLAQLMGQGAFGQGFGRQYDMNNIFGGLFSLLFGR